MSFMQNAYNIGEKEWSKDLDWLIFEIKTPFFTGYEGHMSIWAIWNSRIKRGQIITQETRCWDNFSDKVIFKKEALTNKCSGKYL